MHSMSKKDKRQPQAPTPPARPPVQEEKANFISMFSKLDSRQKHRILAYLFWLLGIFIILFAYRAS
jgi:cell division septal protein FtsQ